MGMRRHVPVDLFRKTMMLFAGRIDGVHMDDGVGEMGYVMHKVMARFRGDGMPLGDRELGTDGD